MKGRIAVSDDHTENAGLAGRRSRIKSRLTLKFNRASLEDDFNNMLISNTSGALGINLNETLSIYAFTYFFVVILYVISYIIAYARDKSSSENFAFQIAILLSLTLLYLLLLMASYFTILNFRRLSILNYILYILTYTAIILNTNKVQHLIFSSLPSNDFDSILGILPLLFTSKIVIFKGFLPYLIFHVIISTIYIILSLSNSDFSVRIVIEFVFLILSTVTETIKFYNKEKEAREKFLFVKNYLQPVQELKYQSPKTDIEEISNYVKESLNMLTLFNQDKTQNHLSIENAIESLSKIMNLLGNRHSVYSVDMENLNQNLDDDDKKYLKETCVAFNRSAPDSSKVFTKKSIDVIKNYQITELATLLKRIGKEWNFDTFFLNELTKSKPLATIGDYCLKRFDLDRTFKMVASVCHSFFKELEGLYKPNPYHNSSHAADVLCSYLFQMQQSVLKESIQESEMLASIIACLAHDVAHPGLTNRFLINSKDPLSLLCNLNIDNDVSVLEMMHCSTTFKIMQNPESNIFSSLSNEQSASMRGVIIELILSTDMSKHFDLIGKFKAKIMNTPSISFESADMRNETMRILMKASDVAHAAKCYSLHQQWTKLVVEEFFMQGDMEKQRGLPVSMYCDRDKTDIPKSQIGFIKNIVMPIYDSIYLCLGSGIIKEFCLDQLENNMLMWDRSTLNKRGMTQLDNKRFNARSSRSEFTVTDHNTKAWFK